MSFRVGLLGAGGMARNHASAMAALPFYYPGAPRIRRVAVSGFNLERREAFARDFDFETHMSPTELLEGPPLDAVFVTGPNTTHVEQLVMLAERGVKRIYVEKPVATSAEELAALESAAARLSPDTKVQVGFQFLQMSSVREAARRIQAGHLGRLTHFRIEYLHSGYLSREYRDRRSSRLAEAPAGGALADLGSHALSFADALLSRNLEVLAAARAPGYPDVPERSDLASTVMLRDKDTGAVGTVVASRISPGCGDVLRMEAFGDEGAIRVGTDMADELIYSEPNGKSTRIPCGNDYRPYSAFPGAACSVGWLRSLIHAHAMFFGAVDDALNVPNLPHAFRVQRLVNQAVEAMDRSGTVTCPTDPGRS